MKNEEAKKILKELRDLIFEDGATEKENRVERERREALSLAITALDENEELKAEIVRSKLEIASLEVLTHRMLTCPKCNTELYDTEKSWCEQELSATKTERDRYKIALEKIVKHMKIVIPHGYKVSTVYTIAKSALQGE